MDISVGVFKNEAGALKKHLWTTLARQTLRNSAFEVKDSIYLRRRCRHGNIKHDECSIKVQCKLFKLRLVPCPSYLAGCIPNRELDTITTEIGLEFFDSLQIPAEEFSNFAVKHLRYP